jgi:hypothetical protein
MAFKSTVREDEAEDPHAVPNQKLNEVITTMEIEARKRQQVFPGP